MPAAETVVADTSPLLNLALIEELRLVDRRWDTVSVPVAVWEELSAGEAGLDALRSLRHSGGLRVVDVDHADLYVALRHELDRGEAAAITLALESDADVILLDEREARTVARRHDLQITGDRRPAVGSSPKRGRNRAGARLASIGRVLDRRGALRSRDSTGERAI